ncbi:MAG: glycosyltransferase family 4 protein [Patescibacteria group bacterium]|jgi:glycosyltransferase involved in cell wall biosynthesis
MKICLISNLYPPISRGGAERVAERVARGLVASGPHTKNFGEGVNHEVFVISTKPWDGWKSFKAAVAEENGIKVYRFYPANVFYYLNDYKQGVFSRMIWHFFDMFNCQSARAVKKILRAEKPDLVLTHNLMGIGFLIPRAIKKLKIKHIHTLHDVQLSVPSGLILKGRENNWEQRTWLRKLYEAACRRLFASSDVVVSPSKWLLDFYAQKGFFKKSKKEVLPNPVERIYPAGIPMDNSILKLLYLGQIEEHKGILFLVKVLKNLDINFKLHIAGDGSEMEELKKMVDGDNRFVIHGKLVGEEAVKIFNLVDLTVVPSLCYENSPSVIYESLAAGVPVLAAKIGGVAELVHDNENGFTFEAGNAEDLARALKQAAANRESLQKMRPAAARSVEDFKIEKYISRLLEIIK